MYVGNLMVYITKSVLSESIGDVVVVEDNTIKKIAHEQGYKGNWKKLGDILKNYMQNYSTIKGEQSKLIH